MSNSPNQRPNGSVVTGILIVILLVLIAAPWVVNSLFAPLQPPVLALTPTAYVSIAADFHTRQAQTEQARPSVLTTDVHPSETPELNPAQPSSIVTPSVTNKAVSRQLEPANVQVRYIAATNTPAAPLNTAAAATATIKLPSIATATALPPVPVHIELTDQQASQAIQKQVTDIHDLQVAFLQDSLKITGSISVKGPLNVDVPVGMEIDGILVLNNDKLLMQVTTVTVGGKDQTASGAQQAQDMINNWLISYLVQKKVTSYQVVPGKLIIEALQLSTSTLPTSLPDPTKTVPPPTISCLKLTTSIPLAGTVSATPTAVSSVTATATVSGTPSATPKATPGCPDSMVAIPVVTQSGGGGYTLPATIPPAPTNEKGGVTLTDSQATTLSGGSIGPLRNTHLSFSTSGVTITAELDPASIGNGIIPSGLGVATIPVTVTGQITAADGRPHLTGATVQVANSQAINIKNDVIFQAVDTWLATILPGHIGSLNMTNGLLNVMP